MGTIATLTLARPVTADVAEECFNAATSIVGDIEQTMSFFRADSDVSRLNDAAGGDAIPVGEHTLRTLKASLRYAELTGGAFDPTVGPLVALWGFGRKTVAATLPAEAELEAARQLVGFRHVQVSDSMAGLAIPNMKIDFGGIAKGYAVDRCFEQLARGGVENYMVDIGGNLRVQGRSRPGVPWRIGVRDPFDRDRIVGTIQLPSGMAVATSGNYERFVTIEGRRFTHVIDPRTGTPVAGMAGVTVLCPSATQADAMSTALFVLGLDGASAVLSSMPDCHALFIPDTNPPEIVVSPGMTRFFTPRPERTSCLREWGPCARAWRE